MANVQSVTDTKIGGTFGVDKNEVPTGWLWKVRRTIVFDDGTSTDAYVDVPFTNEELAAHIDASLASQAASIAADGVQRTQLQSSVTDLTAKLAQAKTALEAVASADAAWDTSPRSNVAAALTAIG